MDSPNPPRMLSTRVPLVVGAITTLMWICVPVLAIVAPMMVMPPEGADAEWTGASRGARPTGRHAMRAAVAGEPSELTERLRAAGFADDPNMTGRRRSRSFGAWMVALRYADEESACSVLLEGTTSTTVEFVEIEATFSGRVGAAEVARLVGPALAILDPGARPVMIVAAIHDGSGTVGSWYAERQPREGGGMAVVLVTGQPVTVPADD